MIREVLIVLGLLIGIGMLLSPIDITPSLLEKRFIVTNYTYLDTVADFRS